MKFKSMVALSVATLITFSASAVPLRASYDRYSLFIDSSSPFVAADYTSATTTSLGTVKFLKYSTSVQTKLVNTLAMTNKYASSKPWNGGNYQQISENGNAYVGQCVGFAKAMTGVGATSTWTKVATNALTSIFPNNGSVGSVSADIALPPGTMIVNFDGGSAYPNTPTSHVAIVLSVVVANGKVSGVNAVAQNAIGTIGGVPADKMISKYFIPWNNANSSLTSLSLKNYHVINQ